MRCVRRWTSRHPCWSTCMSARRPISDRRPPKPISIEQEATMTTRRRFIAAAGASALAGLSILAAAQDKPKLGRIIVGFPAGGSNDAVARMPAEKMQGRYAETLIVENKAGAGGRIGVDYVRRATGDGSTILQT